MSNCQCVRIDSLGVIACSINPKVMCNEVVWLVKRSEPACIQVLRVFNGKTLFYSQAYIYMFLLYLNIFYLVY